MAFRYEIEVRVIDEKSGRTVRSAADSGSDEHFEGDEMLGILMASMLDWLAESSLLAVGKILEDAGEGRDWEPLRKIASAINSWDGSFHFDECVTVSFDEDKLRGD